MSNDHRHPILRRRPERGLTLLEIMIVIAILGLVMGLIVVPAVMDRKLDAERRTAKIAVTRLAYETFPQWSIANPSQQCPPDLKALSNDAGNTTDPWGKPYKMLCGGSLPPGVQHIAFLSLGPDRAENTEDDIKSW